MTIWNAALVTGVATIWVAMVSAVAYACARRANEVRARGLEPPRAARPNGT